MSNEILASLKPPTVLRVLNVKTVRLNGAVYLESTGEPSPGAAGPRAADDALQIGAHPSMTDDVVDQVAAFFSAWGELSGTYPGSGRRVTAPDGTYRACRRLYEMNEAGVAGLCPQGKARPELACKVDLVPHAGRVTIRPRTLGDYIRLVLTARALAKTTGTCRNRECGRPLSADRPNPRMKYCGSRCRDREHYLMKRDGERGERWSSRRRAAHGVPHARGTTPTR